MGTLASWLSLRKLALALLLVLLPACSKPRSSPLTSHFTFGNEVVLATKQLGSAGGTIVAPRSSELAGVSATFPPGALAQPVEVSLGYNTGSLQAAAGQPSGKSVVLRVGEVRTFNYPVLITIPQAEKDKVAIPYYVDESGKLHLAQVVAVDRKSGRVSFYTLHASLWTWIIETWAGLTGGNVVPIDADTDYRPKLDGFQVFNTGSSINSGGECLGMATWSVWYYLTHRSEGPFFDRFMGTVNWDWLPVAGQDVIATRAHSSTRGVVGLAGLTPGESFATIVRTLANTQTPVPLGLISSKGGTGHAVVAYAETDGKLSIYDPNWPGVTNTITFDAASQTYASYSGFDQIHPLGEGSYNLDEPYSTILEDAKAGFHSSLNAVLKVTSHQHQQSVVAGPVTLKGQIESGNIMINKLQISATRGATVTRSETAIDEKGAFSLTVTIAPGENQLAFVTSGTVGGEAREVPNNFGANSFMLVGCPASGCTNCCPRECMFNPMFFECTVNGEPCLRCGPALDVVCGDKTCTAPSETCLTCPADCGTCQGCGNDTCEPDKGETCKTCPQDCGDQCPVCGDGSCWYKLGESCSNCPQDCDECARCGDNSCRAEEGETCSTCPQDCGECPKCGDKSCWPDIGESCSTCPQDCGECPKCGDGSCWTESESCASCPQDCCPSGGGDSGTSSADAGTGS